MKEHNRKYNNNNSNSNNKLIVDVQDIYDMRGSNDDTWSMTHSNKRDNSANV